MVYKIGKKNRQLLLNIAGLLYVVSVLLAVLSFINAEDNSNLQNYSLITAMTGFAINLIKIGIDNQENNNKVNHIEERMEVLIKNNQVLHDHIIFANTVKDKNVKNNPHLSAFLLAGEKYAFQHLKNLTSDYKRLIDGQPIEIKDIPITADFLSNIVSSLDPIKQSCVWMGTSRVVDPIGWNLSNDPLFRFAESIRNRAIKKRGDFEKLHVYRLYSIDSNQSDEAINKRVKDLYRIHLKNELTYDIKIKLLYSPVLPIDLSLVLIPSHKFNKKEIAKELITPNHTIEYIEKNGWKIICGIHWDVRNYYFIEGAKVYPEGDEWVKNNYLKYRKMWAKGVDVNLEKEPHFDRSHIYL